MRILFKNNFCKIISVLMLIWYSVFSFLHLSYYKSNIHQQNIYICFNFYAYFYNLMFLVKLSSFFSFSCGFNLFIIFFELIVTFFLFASCNIERRNSLFINLMAVLNIWLTCIFPGTINCFLVLLTKIVVYFNSSHETNERTKLSASTMPNWQPMTNMSGQ